MDSEQWTDEPFACPACGQMLAPSCRVCVACGQTIDLAEIARLLEGPLPAAPAPTQEPRLSPVPFPWLIFLVVLGVLLALGQISLAIWGEQKAPWVMQAVPMLAGIWVYFDALRRGVPRPLRWGLGTILLLIVVFPWYLARRTEPQSPVPFVEAKVGSVTRVILYAFIALFLLSAIMYVVQGPTRQDKEGLRILMPK
jgi:4-amino-4-deoxy-L-arabinose transferase-like glycosyltransferase